jgi:hypothetical protein
MGVVAREMMSSGDCRAAHCSITTCTRNRLRLLLEQFSEYSAGVRVFNDK